MSDRLLFVALILFSFGTWLLSARHVQTGDAAAGGVTSPFATIIWALIYVAAFAGVFVRRKAALELARASLPLVLILLLTCSSTLWSDQPALTARRSIELSGTVALAVYFASRLGLQAFTEALALAITIAAAASLILVTSFPNIGLDPENDLAWAGFFGSKNFLGETMVLGMLATACLFDRSHGMDRVRRVAQFALFLILLVGSGNGSGAGIAITLALLIPALLLSRAKQSRNFALLGALFFVAAMLIGLMSENFLSLFGKDATLSGRTILWQFVVDAIGQKPAFGYGYAAFWGQDAPAASLVYRYINWIPGTAHNGFLEVALNCGIIGEILFVWLLALALWRASAMFWQGRDILSGWPLFSMLCIIFKNVSEASLLVHGEADWIIFVAAFVFATDARKSREASCVR